MKILSRIQSLFLRGEKNIAPITITPDLVDRLSAIYAYRKMMQSGDYNDEITYNRNRGKCREIMEFLCELNYKLIKE